MTFTLQLYWKLARTSILLFGSQLEMQSHIADFPCNLEALHHIVQAFGCLGQSYLVLPSCWVTESPASSSGLWSQQQEGMSCLSACMWHCAHLSSLWSDWFSNPGEFPVQVLAQPPAMSVGRATGRSSKKVLCVGRKDMNKVLTCIVMSLVALGPSYFLYVIYPIAWTHLWSRISLPAQRSAAELLLTSTAKGTKISASVIRIISESQTQWAAEGEKK